MRITPTGADATLGAEDSITGPSKNHLGSRPRADSACAADMGVSFGIVGASEVAEKRIAQQCPQI